jgi:alpha-glucosidase
VGDGDIKLFARWLTIGAFAPMCRIHAMIDSRDSEPWSYGEKVESIAQNFINLRYRLMPYYYSLFKEMEETGMPVQRSLAFSDPYAWQTYDYRYQNQSLIGDFLLIAPVSAYQHFGQIFLPERNGDSWYYLYTDSQWPAGEPVARAPLEFLPVFVAPGAILPMRSVVQHDGQQDDGILTIHLYKGSTPTEFDLYWDEGDGYGYQEGKYHRRLINYNPAEQSIILQKAQGTMELPWKSIQFLLHGFHPLGQVLVNNQAVDYETVDYRFVEPLPAFDPFGNDTTTYSCSVQRVELSYTQDELILTMATP